ncbi:hypothetical protein F5Y16DRAFT_387305, partial [Xylariaceae sp. FL0255]
MKSHVWFCCNCGYGPLSMALVAYCDSCQVQRCGYCRIEEVKQKKRLRSHHQQQPPPQPPSRSPPLNSTIPAFPQKAEILSTRYNGDKQKGNRNEDVVLGPTVSGIDPSAIGIRPLVVSDQHYQRELRTMDIAKPLQQEDILRPASGHPQKAQPTTDTEHQLQKIWSKALHIETTSISIDTAFLMLGGDSVSAIEVLFEARKCGMNFTMLDIVREGTIAKLADRITIQSQYTSTRSRMENLDPKSIDISGLSSYSTPEPSVQLKPEQYDTGFAENYDDGRRIPRRSAGMRDADGAKGLHKAFRRLGLQSLFPSASATLRFCGRPWRSAPSDAGERVNDQSSSASLSSEEGRNASNEHKKRYRPDSQNDEEDDLNDAPKKPKPFRHLDSDEFRLDKRFACPFQKLNPYAYSECDMVVIRTVSQLGTHLRKAHTEGYFCDACQRTFDSDRLRRDHITKGICQQARGNTRRDSIPKEHTKRYLCSKCCKVFFNDRELGSHQISSCRPTPGPPVDGIFPISKTQGHSDVQRWNCVWSSLFPDALIPNSPWSNKRDLVDQIALSIDKRGRDRPLSSALQLDSLHSSWENCPPEHLPDLLNWLHNRDSPQPQSFQDPSKPSQHLPEDLTSTQIRNTETSSQPSSEYDHVNLAYDEGKEQKSVSSGSVGRCEVSLDLSLNTTPPSTPNTLLEQSKPCHRKNDQHDGARGQGTKVNKAIRSELSCSEYQFENMIPGVYEPGCEIPDNDGNPDLDWFYCVNETRQTAHEAHETTSASLYSPWLCNMTNDTVNPDLENCVQLFLDPTELRECHTNHQIESSRAEVQTGQSVLSNSLLRDWSSIDHDDLGPLFEEACDGLGL